MLQVVSANPDLLHPNGFVPKRRRKYQQPFINHLASLRNWIKETSRRARSPNSKASTASKSPTATQSKSPDSRRRLSNANRNSSLYASNSNTITPTTSHIPTRPRGSTHGSNTRPSISPAPLTPRGSYRRSSGGLRGRKSTSSSISSIRSMPHHHHSHSKASSTSSASVTSPAVSLSGHHKTKSPHSSVKVLPATPTNSSFPTNIRVVRTPLLSANSYNNNQYNFLDSTSAGSEGGAAFGSVPPPSPGLIFAKRKRSPFKGPMLNINTQNERRMRGDAGSRSTSVQGRKSGEIMGIAEEEEDEEEEIEEVDEFTPTRAGETAEAVLEEDEGLGMGNLNLDGLKVSPVPIVRTENFG